jgi:polysaccharide biosynthesis/export protein
VRAKRIRYGRTAAKPAVATRAVLPFGILLMGLWLSSPAACCQSNIPDAGSAAPAPRDNSSSQSSSQPLANREDNRYRLCASDVIAINFQLTPEFDQIVSVQPDGYVALSGVGDVYVLNLTTQQAVDAMKTAYAGILHDPLITLELKDFNKPYFIVNGQVNHPGRFDLRGTTTATQAVAIAGGFTESARHSQVLLFRRANNDWYEVKDLDLKKILRGQDLSEDAEIHSGDLLYVPQNFLSKIRRFIPSSGVGAYYQP